MNNQKISMDEMKVNVGYGKGGNAYGVLVNAIINHSTKAHYFQLLGETGSIYTFDKAKVAKKDLPALEEKVSKLMNFKTEVAKSRQAEAFKALVTQ